MKHAIKTGRNAGFFLHIFQCGYIDMVVETRRICYVEHGQTEE